MKCLIVIIPLILSLAVCACGGDATLDLKAADLRCEYTEEPVIDTTAPRLSWKLVSEHRGIVQASYRILAATSRDALSENDADLWDSGRVESDQSVHVVYDGEPLESRTECWWTVRVWDAEGNDSGWSNPSRFEVGLLDRRDWGASWIGDGKPDPASDEDFFANDPTPLFRREFAVTKAVKRARLYITGLGYYEAYLNGQRIGDAMLDPAWTTYSKRILYSIYDVAGMLDRGDNALGVTLGNGWYNPLPMRMWGRYNLREFLTTGRPRFIARLEIEYADGSSDVVVSDGGWKVTEGPVVRNNIYLGEIYDARREIPGWNRAGFDDTAWTNAVIADEPGGELRVQAQPPIEITDSFEHLRFTEPEPGVFIFDMGRNFAGWAGLTVRGPAGTKVVMRYGELLYPDGTLNVMTSTCGQIKPGVRNQPEGVPIPACQTDTYILKGGGKNETYIPRFTFRGFRYVEIVGYDGESTIDGVLGLRLNAAVDPCGTFECSNQLFNSIQDMVERTFLSNIFGVQSDCPQRERFGYGGDIVPTCEAFMFNYDMATLYPKIVRDFADAARGNGGLTETAPYMGIASEGFGDGTGPVGWTLAFPYLLERLYRFYGNEQLIAEQYDTVKRLVEFLRANATDHIIDRGIGDHESIDAKDTALTGTAFYYDHVRLLAWMAGILGREGDAKEYAELRDDIARAFVQRFHTADGNHGVYGNGMQAAQATALYYGFDQQIRDSAFERLIEEIERHERHLSTGIFGTKFMLDVLSRPDGRPDLAYDIVNQRTFPGWGHMLENGATTLWEHWEFSDNTYSHNHPMFGSVSEWFYRVIAGINPAPDAVGFDKIIIRPQTLGDLSWAKGSYESIRGTIVSDWTIEGGVFRLDVTIPATATAEIHVPAKSPDDVTEGGIHADTADGVTYRGMESGCAVFAVGSGSYHFEAMAP